VDVDGDILVASNSWIIPVSQPTNGGSVLFRVHGITLDVGGGFDANGCGWAGGPSPDGNGFGPGGGQGGGHGAGGGYGGRGGDDYATSKGGAPYGSSNAPVQPGSGGGASSPAVSAGGYGGGLVRIEAINIVTVNGLVSANGTTGNDAGGGSGGGVYVRCKRFGGAATGRVTANGGNAGDPVYGGAGAGGRIAIWYSQGYDYLGSYQAATGTATTTYGKVAASNGTIVVDWMRMAQGAIFILR
jgi:hypothetical protein